MSQKEFVEDEDIRLSVAPKPTFVGFALRYPGIPIGLASTTAVLIFGIRAMSQGNPRNAQLAMRGRVFAQGFTVVAVLHSLYAISRDMRDTETKHM